jgi:Tfp pilus assembly protein PilO
MTKSIVAILFLGASILAFVLYVRPAYDTVQANRTKVAEYDRALEKTREIQELKSSLLSRYNLFAGPNLDRLQKMLPDHVDNVQLVLDMDGIASKYGIRIQNVSVQQAGKANNDGRQSGGTVLSGGSTPGKPYQSIELQFEVVSTYDEFVRLLRDLESSLRVVDLVSLTLRPFGGASAVAGRQGTAEQLYTFGISLRTYWLK